MKIKDGLKVYLQCSRMNMCRYMYVFVYAHTYACIQSYIVEFEQMHNPKESRKIVDVWDGRHSHFSNEDIEGR